MENTDYKNINGWGIDADPKNEPTYPMKNWTGDDHKRIHWDRPQLKSVNTEILKSVEHARMPAVFGTSVPPSGLSGKMRRFAFTYSEGKWWHWLALLAADRVNMVEGIVDDLSHGYVPNVFAERGWKAEFKYNRASATKKLATGIFVVAALGAFLYAKNKKPKLKF